MGWQKHCLESHCRPTLRKTEPETRPEIDRPELEPVPVYLRDTEEPLLGLLLLLGVMSHSIRAVAWVVDPPDQGGPYLAAVSASLALLTLALRHLIARVRAEGSSFWLPSLAIGIVAGSTQATFSASGDVGALALLIAFLLVLRNDSGRSLACLVALALPVWYLDLSDAEVLSSLLAAVAVAIAGSGLVHRRTEAADMRLAVRSRLADVIRTTNEWSQRRTAMIAGLAHDIRGPLSGAALAIQAAEVKFGEDLALVLREAGERLERQCFDLAERMTAIIPEILGRAGPMSDFEAADPGPLLRKWHAAEQVDLPIFMLTLTGLLFVFFGLQTGAWFGRDGLVLLALAVLYAAAFAGVRAAHYVSGSDALTWMVLAPGLLWFGSQAAVLKEPYDLALALTIFWLGIVSSRSLRTVFIAGALMLAFVVVPTTTSDQLVVFLAIWMVGLGYRRAVSTLAADAAEWSLRLERRQTQVQRDADALDRTIDRHVQEVRDGATQIVEDSRSLLDLAREQDRVGAVELYERACDSLGGLDALLTVDQRSGASVKTTTRVRDVTNWLSSVFTDRIEAKGGTLVVRVPPDVEVPMPEGALKKILINLVDNAIKFSPQGGRVAVEARRLPTDGRVALTIVDQGQGIPETEIDRLFGWLEQGGERADTGFGIGLAVVSKLVSDFGGQIDVESQPGSTCMRVSFSA